MKKKKMLFIMIFFLGLFFGMYNLGIFASEIENVPENNIEDSNDIENLDKQKEKILNMIQECIKSMKSKLIAMDSKEAKAKAQKEFENYPAIRLNIDTPVFGVIAMVDNKLKIRKDVSTVDVANGYSIEEIINKNKIKLPDFTVGSIVVTTRDVSIDENMSYEDANVALLKIMQYMSQLDSADEFLDFQINRIFKGYIDKEKSDKISDVKNRNNKITSELIDIDKKITYLHIIKNNDEKLTEINKTFDELINKNKNINLLAKDNLISNEDLLKLQKNVIDLEGKIVEFSLMLDEEYNTAFNSIDEEKMLKSIREELVDRKDYIEKYINDSVYIKKIENIDEIIDEINDEVTDVNKNAEDSIEEKSDEIIVKYEVTSKNTLDYLNASINSIDQKIEEYIKDDTIDENVEDKNESVSQEVVNKEEVTQIKIHELSKEEKKELVEEIYKIYVDFLSRENKFYLDNTNFLISNTTNKIADLTGKTDGDVLEYMKYMYIELPSNLKGYINDSNMSSQRELKKLTNNLKKELVNIVNSNENVNILYNNMKQEELRS